MQREELEIWLCSIPGIGIHKLMALQKSLGEPEAVFRVPEKRLAQIDGITIGDAHKIVKSRQTYESGLLRQKLKHENMLCYTYFSEQYPERCRHIYHPPKWIFCRGRLPGPGVNLAVVGARNCSCYGRETARHFASCLAEAGIAVISGMARGIDGWAHQGALEGGGETYAVLGNSAEICYPREHERLYRSILKQGGVLSEYPPGTRPAPGLFPMRNRIISALSDGILVVEARAKSGSLITADEALNQGKDVFVIPGRIDDALSEGCNHLIKQGAFLVTSPEEILEFYGLEKIKKTEKFTKINISLERNEKMVYASLSLEPKHLNEMAEELQMESAEVMKCVLSLRKNRLIKEIGNHYYIKNVI